MTKLFTKETDLVAAFVECLGKPPKNWGRVPPIGEGWTAYHETAGWDILLSHNETGMQLGIEAKLSLNPKVLDQALIGLKYADSAGPDYRAVLVPRDGCQQHMDRIATHLGIAIITVGKNEGEPGFDIYPHQLPTETQFYWRDLWPSWLPMKRHPLPDYVPDVSGGAAAPVALTPWKVKAIKLMILLERSGYVHRKDMKALDLSPTRWTDCFNGFLVPTPQGYARGDRTPDLKAQHPRNWAEIEADFDEWNPRKGEGA